MADSTPGNHGWQPDPQLIQPPRHDLSYWLEPRTSNVSQPEAGSALGIAAITNLLTANAAPLPALWLGLGAAALLVIGSSFWRRALSAVPKVRFLSTGRASVSVAGGWILAAFIGLPLLGVAHVVLEMDLDGTLRGMVAYAGYQLAILTFVIAAIYVPGHFSQHARRDLRRLIDANPEIRAELEVASRTWVDPVGTRSFGPL